MDDTDGNLFGAGAEDDVDVGRCAFELRDRYVMSKVKEMEKRLRERFYPNGSPTTRKAMSWLSASCKMLSLSVSTMSRSARRMGLP